MRKLQITLPALLIVLLVITACGGPPYKFRGTEYNPIIPAPAIVGTVAGDKPFELGKLNEKVKLVFFGYTFCPDICPTSLANMNAVYEKLSNPERDQVAAVFVSVDPERDTPDRLGDYVRAFNPDFYGVHVPAGELATVKQGYGVYAEKAPVAAGQSAADYLVDHTAVVYVIDKHNNLREIFPTSAPAADIAADVQHLLSQ